MPLQAHKPNAVLHFVEIKYVKWNRIIFWSHAVCNQHEYYIYYYIRQSLMPSGYVYSCNIKGDNSVSPFIFGHVKSIIASSDRPRKVLAA